MVTISRRNDKHLAMKVSHVVKYDVKYEVKSGRRFHPMKSQFDFYDRIIRQINKGVSIQRNCSVASVGDYNRVIWYYQLS